MTWYKPSSWFSKKVKESPVAVRCDNPECKGIIDSEAMYEPKHGKIYHMGQCQMIGQAHLAWDSGDAIISNFEPVSLDEAIKLYRKGKLKQSCSS